MEFTPHKIEDCCHILNYLRFPMNSEQRYEMKGEFPYYGANGVQDHINIWRFDDDLILIAEDGGNFEQFATRPIAYRVHGKCWVNNHAHVLKAKDGFSQDFIFYALEHKNILCYIAGGTRSKLNQSELKKIIINHPIKEEADRVGEILKTTDSTISHTKALIAKYQRIKTGLMQDLLTKGIDENGNIRSKATHTFVVKNGIEVPEEWEVKELGKFCSHYKGSVQTGPFGSQLHSEDYKSEGIPIITVEHLIDSKITHKNLPLVGALDYIRLKKYKLETGDLVFSRVGAIDRCSIVTEKENGWLFSGRCLRVKGGIGFNPNFLLYQMNFDIVRNQILTNAVGSTMKCLNTKIVSDIFVFRPGIEEQNEIVLRIKSFDSYLDSEIENLNKLYLLKTGLMQVLLSGKVSVAELVDAIT